MASVSNKFLVAVLAVFVLVACIASAQSTSCQVPNCGTCSATSEFSCATCNSGYIPSGGQCSPSTYCGVTYCNACVSGSVTRCASCQSGYTVTSSGLCAKKVHNGAAAPAAVMWTAAAAVAAVVAYAL